MIRELTDRFALLRDRVLHRRLRHRYPPTEYPPADVGTAIEARVAGLLRNLGRPPVAFTVVRRERLDPEDPEHATWLVELETAEEVADPLPGDMLYVRWENRDEEVNQVIRLLGATGNEPVRLSTESSMFGPGHRERVPFREAIERFVEIEEASPALLRKAGLADEARHNANEARRHDRYHREVLSRRDWAIPHPHLEPIRIYAPSVLRSLSVQDSGPGEGRSGSPKEQSAAAGPPTPQEFVDRQGRVSGRPYTISRFERAGGNRVRVELTVSEVEKELRTVEGRSVTVPARTSSYLSRLNPGDRVHAWVLPELHRFPVSLGRDVPTIVICTGSGVSAPLSLLRSGASRGPLWIIYGVRSWERKALYAAELSAYVEQGLITRLDVATSRPLPGEGPRRRVQQVIREERATVARWLRDGAHVYLSGRLSMGREAGELFVELLESEGFAANAEEARALLDRWRSELRFQASVSGV